MLGLILMPVRVPHPVFVCHVVWSLFVWGWMSESSFLSLILDSGGNAMPLATSACY